MSPTRLAIPGNTRLMTVWRVLQPDGSVMWQAVTACHDKNAPYRDLLGTSLRMYADGHAERHTIRPDDTEMVLQVMPKIGE